MASRRNWRKSARPAGFPSGGCPQCQADLPDARIALHVLSGGSTRQMRNRIDSIKDDHALKLGVKGWNDSEFPLIDGEGYPVSSEKAEIFLTPKISAEQIGPKLGI